MRVSELIELSDANLAESHREFARFHPEGLIQETADLLLTRGAREYPGLNFAMRVGPQPSPPPQLLQKAQRFFAHPCRGFAVRTRVHADQDLIAFLGNERRYRGGDTVGMYSEGTLPALKIPAGVAVRPVETVTRAAEFIGVVSHAFATEGLHEDVSRTAFTQRKRLIAAHLRGFITYHGDEPVSVALALLCHGTAGIYWVGTTQHRRRRGFARIALRAAHNWACDHGARAVMLQCSPKHVPLYASLGYQELTRYPWFMVAKHPDQHWQE